MTVYYNKPILTGMLKNLETRHRESAVGGRGDLNLLADLTCEIATQ